MAIYPRTTLIKKNILSWKYLNSYQNNVNKCTGILSIKGEAFAVKLFSYNSFNKSTATT